MLESRGLLPRKTEPQTGGGASAFCAHWKWTIVLIATIIVVGAGLAIGLTLGLRKDNEDAGTGTALPTDGLPTISGQSAGGSMAMQHLVVYSGSVAGAMIAAGSPYGCGSQHEMSNAQCMVGDFTQKITPKAAPNESLYYYTSYSYADVFGGISLDKSVEIVKDRSVQGLIDDYRNLRSTPVLLFQGRSDTVVLPPVMLAVRDQLQQFVAPDKLLLRLNNTAAGHVWSIDRSHCACGPVDWSAAATSLCVNAQNCHYDLTGDMLGLFFGAASLRPPAESESDERIMWIRQWSYVSQPGRGVPFALADASASQLLEWAPIYVPAGCTRASAGGERCRLHVNYHGCMSPPADQCQLQSWAARLEWLKAIDINRYAETNGLIVLYPQTKDCWPWTAGSGDPMFDTNEGVDLAAVSAMVGALRSGAAALSSRPDDCDAATWALVELGERDEHRAGGQGHRRWPGVMGRRGRK